MKKILLSTIVLTAFSLSVILFQLSCKKDAVADTTTTTVSQQNKLLYVKDAAMWVANYDGSNPRNLNIVLPNGLVLDGRLSISPDRKTIFFSVFYKDTSTKNDIYSCSIDGTNVKKVISGTYEAFSY